MTYHIKHKKAGDEFNVLYINIEFNVLEKEMQCIDNDNGFCVIAADSVQCNIFVTKNRGTIINALKSANWRRPPGGVRKTTERFFKKIASDLTKP